MKKLFAVLLVLTMVFSLAACGDKNPDDTDKNPPATNTPDTNQPIEPVVDAAAKQIFYDKYFTGDEYKPAGNSFKVTSEGINMSQTIDNNGYGVLDIQIKDYFLRLYRVESGVYVHTKGPNEDNPEQLDEIWLTYQETEDGENVLEDNNMNDEELLDVSEALKITYVETQDGVDHVTVEIPNESYEEGVKQTQYEIKFLLKDKEYTATITTMVSEDFTGNLYDNNDVLPENFELNDYELDATNKVLVNKDDENDKIACTIISEKDITPAPTQIFDFYIDVKEHTVVKVGAPENSGYTMMEFFQVDKYEAPVDFVKETQNAQECTDEELGMIIFAMLMMSMAG